MASLGSFLCLGKERQALSKDSIPGERKTKRNVLCSWWQSWLQFPVAFGS